MAKVLKASTKQGQRILSMGMSCYATHLNQLYDSWSAAKENAYEYCFEKYHNTPNSEAFGIGNANTFSFTASWVGTYEDENACFVETRDNSYVILLDR